MKSILFTLAIFLSSPSFSQKSDIEKSLKTKRLTLLGTQYSGVEHLYILKDLLINPSVINNLDYLGLFLPPELEEPIESYLKEDKKSKLEKLPFKFSLNMNSFSTFRIGLQEVLNILKASEREIEVINLWPNATGFSSCPLCSELDFLDSSTFMKDKLVSSQSFSTGKGLILLPFWFTAKAAFKAPLFMNKRSTERLKDKRWKGEISNFLVSSKDQEAIFRFTPLPVLLSDFISPHEIYSILLNYKTTSEDFEITTAPEWRGTARLNGALAETVLPQESENFGEILLPQLDFHSRFFDLGLNLEVKTSLRRKCENLLLSPVRRLMQHMVRKQVYGSNKE